MTRSTLYAKALIDAWQSAPTTDRKQIIDRFVAILKYDRAEALAPDILSAVERELDERAKRQAVRVEVAHENAFPKSAIEALAASVVHQSSDVIGGFRVSREGAVIDASVRGSLAQICKTLAA